MPNPAPSRDGRLSSTCLPLFSSYSITCALRIGTDADKGLDTIRKLLTLRPELNSDTSGDWGPFCSARIDREVTDIRRRL